MFGPSDANTSEKNRKQCDTRTKIAVGVQPDKTIVVASDIFSTFQLVFTYTHIVNKYNINVFLYTLPIRIPCATIGWPESNARHVSTIVVACARKRHRPERFSCRATNILSSSSHSSSWPTKPRHGYSVVIRHVEWPPAKTAVGKENAKLEQETN